MSSSRNRKRRRNSNVPARTDSPILVTWMGEQFRIADKIALMPLLSFGKLATEGVDSLEMEALGAMYDLLESCLDERDWPKFKSHATKVRADQDDLFVIVSKTIEAVSNRPTQRPSGSSAGPSTTQQNSVDASTLEVVHSMDGRPDLQLVVLQAQENQLATAS